jgi:hypothetical protein
MTAGWRRCNKVIADDLHAKELTCDLTQDREKLLFYYHPIKVNIYFLYFLLTITLRDKNFICGGLTFKCGNGYQTHILVSRNFNLPILTGHIVDHIYNMTWLVKLVYVIEWWRVQLTINWMSYFWTKNFTSPKDEWKIYSSEITNPN